MDTLAEQYCKNYYFRKSKTMRVLVADTFFSRARGLLFTEGNLQGAEALLLKNCRAVHTLGMSFPIDIVFIDASHRVVKSIRSARPGVLSFSHKQACAVLERKSDESDWPMAGTALQIIELKNKKGVL